MPGPLEGHTWPLEGSLGPVGSNPCQIVLSFQPCAQPCQLLNPAPLLGCWCSPVSGTSARPTPAMDSGSDPLHGPAAWRSLPLPDASRARSPGLSQVSTLLAASSSQISSICGHLQTELLEPSWHNPAFSMTGHRGMRPRRKCTVNQECAPQPVSNAAQQIPASSTQGPEALRFPPAHA